MNWLIKAKAILCQLFCPHEYTEEEKLSLYAQCNPDPIVKALILNDPKKLRKALVNTPNVATKLQNGNTYCNFLYFGKHYYGGIRVIRRVVINLVDHIILMTNGDHLQCILLLLEFGGKIQATKDFLLFHYEYLQIYLAGGVCNADMFSNGLLGLCHCVSCYTCSRYKISRNILEMWPLCMLIYCLHCKNCNYFI